MKVVDEKSVCPLMSDHKAAVPCQRERCAWWVESKDDRYSTCAVHKSLDVLFSTFFELKKGGYE